MRSILLALLFLVSGLAPAAVTNFPGGVGMGTTAAGNYVVLTPVALTYETIPLNTLRNGDFFTFNNVSVATGAYWATVTGMTNSAALVCAAVDGVSLVAQTIIPINYRSGGVLQVAVHASGVTNVAKSLTFTAYATTQSPGALTVTTATNGTGVNPTASLVGTTVEWVSLTNAHTYVPGDVATWRLTVDGVLARKEILAVRFKYRPYGVFK